jgi:glycosyltransferase involved in cell wall biosynthesis
VDDAGVTPGRVSCVLNGIEPIDTDGADAGYVNDVFGFPRNSIIVVSTGRASAAKGLDSLIECAIRLQEAGLENLRFLHCGDGPDLDRLRRKVIEKGLDRRFVFAGRRSDVRRILPGCHIGVQISSGEAFSLALLEYLGAGLATLASDVGGNPEAIVQGETGFLFPPDDLDKAVDLIEMLSRNEARRIALGVAARASVRAKFDIRRTNRDFVSVYERILAQEK